MPACSSCWNEVFQYETNKVTQIQSTNYGTIKWFLHMIVLFYISFALLSDKLYQRKEPVISSVNAKVKGIAEVAGGAGGSAAAGSIFDTADYTFGLQGNSFFVMTNFLKTEGQQQKLCPEYPTRRTVCSSDRGCKKGWTDPLGKGIQTGKCISFNATHKTCEVRGWCPAEAVEEAPRPALLRSAENFTVLIKNNIGFPGYNYTTRNILPDLNVSCTFHKTQNPQCPIFRLGDILREAGENFSEVAIQGGIMGIEIYWDCNLDQWSHHCRPKYSFRRLDDKTTTESLIPGYNFRFAKYYRENNVEYRTLIKVFGIRFDILVFGTGGKFDIIQLVVYIGSTLSYFGLATVFIDFLIKTYSNSLCQTCVYSSCKCCKPCMVNEYYYRKKFEFIVEPSPTLKYVSFVDEPYIRMVDQKLLGKSLQDAKGRPVPRPESDFTALSALPLPDLDVDSQPEPAKAEAEELQPLRGAPAPEPADGPSPGWCRCGRCRPSALPEPRRPLEELCCRRAPGPCITSSPLFAALVLCPRRLQMLLLLREPLGAAPPAAAASRRLRHCAYRCYAAWRFGGADLADFAILPSCCRWRIRREFPRADGRYRGFQSPC
ncbi:P2X purinoceptor 7-like [Dipodomys merriami]|uniref:P2X purinoceptor 7-like n=1 Tax=Dipodomys merriami TaxID=94247 RepID=UPI0038558E8B